MVDDLDLIAVERAESFILGNENVALRALDADEAKATARG